MENKSKPENLGKLEKAQKIVGVFYLITMAAAVIYMCYGIYTLKNSTELTSFPWWSACYFAAINFGPFLLIELFLFIILGKMQKKTED